MSVFDELYKEDIEALGQIDNGAEITGRTDDDVVSCLHALSFVHICTHVNWLMLSVPDITIGI